MTAFIIALKELASGLDILVKRAEPWGIMLAVLGLGFSIYQFGEEREERRETRQFIAEERTARAWEQLLATGPGDAGRGAAIAHLSRTERAIFALDLSCNRNAGTVLINGEAVCRYPVVIPDLVLQEIAFVRPNFSYARFICSAVNPKCGPIGRIAILDGDISNFRITNMFGEYLNIEDTVAKGAKLLGNRFAKLRFEKVYMQDFVLEIDPSSFGSHGAKRDGVPRMNVEIERSNMSGMRIIVQQDSRAKEVLGFEMQDNWFWEGDPPIFSGIDNDIVSEWFRDFFWVCGRNSDIAVDHTDVDDEFFSANCVHGGHAPLAVQSSIQQ